MQVTFNQSRIIDLEKYPPQGQLIYQRLSELNQGQVWLSQQTQISQGVLSAIIRGKTKPTLMSAIKICTALDITMDDFSNSFMM